MLINTNKEKLNHSFIISLLFLVLFFIQFLIHQELIIQDSLLSVDDLFLINPLNKLSSLFQYSLGKSYDLQPVRDLSFLFQIAVKKSLGFSCFHLVSLLLWLGISLLFFFLMRQLQLGIYSAYFLSLLFSLHPIFVNSISWVAAQKHLLSAFFTILNTLCFLKFTDQRTKQGSSRLFKESLCMAFLFSLAVLSQPITILWPLWASVVLLQRKNFSNRQKIILLSLTYLVLLLTAYFNWQYYLGLSSQYKEQFGSSKNLPFNFETMQMIVMAYGRYFVNLLLPFNFAFNYEVHSLYNLSGIILFIVWTWTIIRWLSREKWIPWFCFYFIHLGVVTLNMTQNFVSDTYILTSAISFFYLNYLLISKIIAGNPFYKKCAYGAGFLMLLFYSISSFNLAKIWRTELTLFTHSYQAQPQNYFNLYYLTKYKLQQPSEQIDYQEVQRLIVVLSESDFEVLHKLVAIKQCSETFYLKIFEHQHLPILDRIKLIKGFNFESSLKNYFLAELYTKIKNHSEAIINSEKLLSEFKANNKIPITVKFERALALYEYNAQQIKKMNEYFQIRNFPKELQRKLDQKSYKESLGELYMAQ